MIDIHTHIIPGVDDGSDNLDDSMEMVRLSARSGVTVLAATPHSNIEHHFENYSTPLLWKSLKELNQRVAEEGIPVKVVSGMEIYATDDVAEKIVEGKLIPINGSRYYLMEFPFDASPRWMNEVISSVLAIRNVVPVIAHPERYYSMQEYPETIWEWVMRGCLFQINKGSVLGKFGPDAFRVSMELMEYNLAACVASDAHTPYARTTYMGEAWEFIAKEYSPAYARLIMEERPGKIIQNQNIEMRDTARSMSRRHYWNGR